MRKSVTVRADCENWLVLADLWRLTPSTTHCSVAFPRRILFFKFHDKLSLVVTGTFLVENRLDDDIDLWDFYRLWRFNEIVLQTAASESVRISWMRKSKATCRLFWGAWGSFADSNPFDHLWSPAKPVQSRYGRPRTEIPTHPSTWCCFIGLAFRCPL